MGSFLHPIAGPPHPISQSFIPGSTAERWPGVTRFLQRQANNRSTALSGIRREEPPREPRELTVLRKHQESNTMLAIIMAGIAGLFIIAIVTAYNYASSTAPPAGLSATASAPATRS